MKSRKSMLTNCCSKFGTIAEVLFFSQSLSQATFSCDRTPCLLYPWRFARVPSSSSATLAVVCVFLVLNRLSVHGHNGILCSSSRTLKPTSYLIAHLTHDKTTNTSVHSRSSFQYNLPSTLENHYYFQ